MCGAERIKGTLRIEESGCGLCLRNCVVRTKTRTLTGELSLRAFCAGGGIKGGDSNDGLVDDTAGWREVTALCFACLAASIAFVLSSSMLSPFLPYKSLVLSSLIVRRHLTLGRADGACQHILCRNQWMVYGVHGIRETELDDGGRVWLV